MRKRNYKWLFNTENVLVASSISSSVASIVFQQAAFAAIGSIPLSLAVSFNSYNRKQLDKLTQQHQVSITQLEQQFSNNKEFVNDFLSSLPNHSELADTENCLEARHTAFAQQLDRDSIKEQLGGYLELQQEVANVQQRLLTVESFVQKHNIKHFYTNSSDSTVIIEEKIKKLEQQFNNLPIFDLQHRTTQVEQLVDNLKLSSTTEFTKLHKSFSGEIQSVNQQVEALTSKLKNLTLAYTEIQSQITLLEALESDLQRNHQNSTELNQRFSKEIDSLRQQNRALSNSVPERINALQVELRKNLLAIEKTENKFRADLYELTNWYRKLEHQVENLFKNNSTTTTKSKQKNLEVNTDFSKQTQYVCDYCQNDLKSEPVAGGYFSNNKFCRLSCRNNFEIRNEIV